MPVQATEAKAVLLCADKNKQIPIYPKTKTVAVSDENGKTLDVILKNTISYDDINENIETIPLNADTLENKNLTEIKQEIYNEMPREQISFDYSIKVETTNWTKEQSGFKASIAVKGLLNADKPIIDLDFSQVLDAEQQNLIIENWGNIRRGVAGNDTLTLYANNKPSCQLPLQLKCIRK